LRLPFVHSVASPYVPLCVGTVCSVVHCHARSYLLYPRGPRSGLGYIVPVHPHLIGLMRPTHGHTAISPQCGLFVAAFAVRVRLGDPQVVPCFHWHPLSTCRPLRPREVHRLLAPSSFTDNASLRLRRTSRHFRSSRPSDSRGAMVFEVYLRFAFATTCRFARPPVGADRRFSQPTRTFTSGLSANWSPAPPPDMTTVATG
jgi:hypothetical protein